jgi:hypothetical protein
VFFYNTVGSGKQFSNFRLSLPKRNISILVEIPDKLTLHAAKGCEANGKDSDWRMFFLNILKRQLT